MGIEMPLADDLLKEETIDNKTEATASTIQPQLTQEERSAMAEPFKVIKS